MGRLACAWVLLWCVGCGSTAWPEIPPHEIEDDSQPVFLVTVGEAFMFHVTRTTDDALHGVAHRAWRFTPSGPFSIRENETPDDVAARLDWVEQDVDGKPRTIPIADVRYASARDSARAAKDVAGSVGFLAGVAAVLMLVASAAVFGLAGVH